MKHLTVSAALLCLGAVAAQPAQARDRISVLHQFDGSGAEPFGNITLWHRQIFGTTSYGGSRKCTAGCGTVYRLKPGAGGRWDFETLYSFKGGADGANPDAQLAVAQDGSVYGYTSATTQGTIFRLVPPAQENGAWAFQTIYTFKNGKDGNLLDVYAPLIVVGGRLYGIASGGSGVCQNYGCGSVFRLDPPAKGEMAWRLVTLYAFGMDGRGAPNGLTGPDAKGAFYASTSYHKGAVVQLAPGHGQADHWDGRVIASFPFSQYGFHVPYNLLLAANGMIYGIASAHGSDVFSLTPPSQGGWWTLTELARFYSGGGYAPSSLAFGPAGSLIGVTYGDQDLYFGNAFQLSPPSGGTGPWTGTILWNFNNGPDQNPNNILAGAHGALFGVLSGGGYSNGTVFQLRP